MWRLYQTAKQSHSRPSTLLNVSDPLTAYQFDSAVALFGIIVENASQEMVKTGTKADPQWTPKYHLDQILSHDFRLPRPPTPAERERSAIAALKALAGVRSWHVPAAKEVAH